MGENLQSDESARTSYSESISSSRNLSKTNKSKSFDLREFPALHLAAAQADINQRMVI